MSKPDPGASAAEPKPATDSVVLKPTDESKKPIMESIVKNFSQQAFVQQEDKGLQLYPQSDSDSDEPVEGESEGAGTVPAGMIH